VLAHCFSADGAIPPFEGGEDVEVLGRVGDDRVGGQRALHLVQQPIVGCPDDGCL
jgi:hypothetical protein